MFLGAGHPLVDRRHPVLGWALRASSRLRVVVPLAAGVTMTLAAPFVCAQPSDESPALTSEPAAEPAPTESQRVRVYLVGRVGSDPVLRQLLEEWLGANAIDYEIARQARLRAADVTSPRTGGAPVRMWIVAVSDDQARLYFAEPDTGRYLVRDVPVPSGFDEVGRERIVQIVLASALAFIEEGASSPREEVERRAIEDAEEPPLPSKAALPVVEPTSPPPPREPQRARPELSLWQTELGIGARYGANSQGRAGVAHGPGLVWLVTRVRGPAEVSLLASGQYRPPHAASTDRVRLELSDWVFAGGVAADLGLVASLSWHSELGAGAQLLRIEPEARSSDVLARGTARDARAFWYAALGPRGRFGVASLALLGRLDVQPVGVRYELESGSARVAELTVARLQPGVWLSAAWHRSISRGRKTP